MKPQNAPVMDEDAQSAPDQGAQQQTAELPLSMFGGQTPKEGDVFDFKVVSVDSQSGSVTVAYSTGEQEEGEPGGTEGMAGAFDRAKMSKEGAY